jgi:hypothetical protein
MRRLLAAALLGFAVCAARAQEMAAAPAAKPDAAAIKAAQDADMEKVRAVLRQMQSESHFSVPMDHDGADDVVIAAPPPKKPLFEVTDGPGGAPKTVGPQLEDGLSAGPHRRRPPSNARVSISPQLKDYTGIDTGKVDVGLGAHGVILSVPF